MEKNQKKRDLNRELTYIRHSRNYNQEPKNNNIKNSQATRKEDNYFDKNVKKINVMVEK